MTSEERAKKYVAAIRQALKQFGEYSYYDKGPHEVMGMPINELKALSVDEVAETLQLVLEKSKKHGEKFVQAVLRDLDEWGRFDELLSKHERLRDHY